MNDDMPIIEENVSGLRVNLVGVKHTLEIFKENEEFYKKQILNAPAIFLEDGPEGFICEYDSEIAKLAKEGGKAIYILEPADGFYIIPELVQLIGGCTLASSFFTEPKSASRRNFLKNGIKTMLGLHLCTGTFIGRSLARDYIKFDESLQYGTVLDYRNIIAAENIDKASKRLKFDRPVPYFMGRRHIDGIHMYLNNPLLRKKRIIYLPQDLISDTTIRKYEYRNGWELTERI